MSRRRLKARDRVTQKMTKEGLVERNETTGINSNISNRDAELDLRGGNVHNANGISAYDMTNGSDGEVQDVSAEAAQGILDTARGVRSSNSQVANKPEGKWGETSVGAAKRNKAAYRRHGQSKDMNDGKNGETPSHQDDVEQSRRPAHEPPPNTSSDLPQPRASPNDDSRAPPNQTNQFNSPKPTNPNSTYPNPTYPNPTNQHDESNLRNVQGNQNLQEPHSGGGADGKLKTQRNVTLHHDKPSALQTNAQSALQNQSASGSILKHDKDLSAGTGQNSGDTAPKSHEPKRRGKLRISDDRDTGTNASADTAGNVRNTGTAGNAGNAHHDVDDGNVRNDGSVDADGETPRSRQTNSQVGNKRNKGNARSANAEGSQSKLREKRNNSGTYRQNKLAPVQYRRRDAESRLLHGDDGAAEAAQPKHGKVGRKPQSQVRNPNVYREPNNDPSSNNGPNSANELPPESTNASRQQGPPPSSSSPKPPPQSRSAQSAQSSQPPQSPQPPPPKSRQLVKAEKGVDRANVKLDKAKDKLPAKKKRRSRLVFDEEKGKAKREFYVDKQVTSQAEHLKGPVAFRPVKMGARSALNFGHSKIFQIEHENVEIKAAHRGEMAAEGGVRGVLRHRKARKYLKVSKLEQKVMKKNVNLTYRKALEKNPKLKSNALSRMWQKRRIKKQYAKAARQAKKGKRAVGGIKNASSLTMRATRIATKLLLNPKVLAVLLIAGLLIAMIMAIVSLGMSIGSGGLGGILNAVYLAEDEDIDAASIAYSEWEVDLRIEIRDVEINYPDFDEYIFDIGDIGHCPHELMAFLTVMFHDFVFDEIEGELRALFDEQYSLTFTPSMEFRTRLENRTGIGIDPETGEPYTYPYVVEVEYEWHILTVTLESMSFTDVIMARMNPEQLVHFNILMHTKGARHHVGSPFPFNWLPFASSHYGWRLCPITGERQLHRGIDIALPTGTEIQAAHDGIVTFAGNLGGFGNVVIIEGIASSGAVITTKYAHCDTILVSEGQEVSMGQPIATVGSTGDSTGPHLHFEVLVDGVHRNPAFFAFTGEF